MGELFAEWDNWKLPLSLSFAVLTLILAAYALSEYKSQKNHEKQSYSGFFVILLFILGIATSFFIFEPDHGFIKIIPGIFDGLFLAIIGFATFDSIKKSYEKVQTKRDLLLTVKYVEKLQNNGFYNSSLQISENLFMDIFKLLEVTDKKIESQINSAYIGNLEIFGKSLQESSDFTNELKNLKCAERIYGEIFQTMLNAPIKLKSKKRNEVLDLYLKPFKNDNMQMFEACYRIIKYINTWLEILIRLSSYLNKKQYIDLAEDVYKWNESLFIWITGKTSDNLTNKPFLIKFKKEKSNKETTPVQVNNCYEVVLQAIKHFRLKGDLFHEKRRLKDYRSDASLRLIEKQYVKSLKLLSSILRNDKIDLSRSFKIDPILNCFEIPEIKNVDIISERILNSLHLTIMPGYFFWEILKECPDKIKYSEYLSNIFKGNPIIEKLGNDFSIETALIYQGIAINKIRNIKSHLNQEFIKSTQFENDDKIIISAFGKMKSLLSIELSWKHCVSFYDNMGIYFRVKGEYLRKVNKESLSDSFLNSAVFVHKMVLQHLTNPALTESNPKSFFGSVKYDKINYLVYLRNLLDLGKAQQSLYSYVKREALFTEARNNLMKVVHFTTKTDNCIYRARAFEFLAELYTENNDYKNAALLSYQYCLDISNKINDLNYYKRICRRMAKFYNENQPLIDSESRLIFAKALNLCLNFGKKECKIMNSTNAESALYELFTRTPDQCSEIYKDGCQNFTNESNINSLDNLFRN